MKYRREIDGLRALAVLPVIFFHAGFKAFEGGFVGVDIFFVISGYLITNIILSDLNAGKFSIVTFYERRARRILPALFFVMLCCLPFAWLWLVPTHLEDFCQSMAAVSVFSSNILFWRESGYFGVASELKPLLHTWSLAVEEQYYLFFPLFLLGLWKMRKRWIFGSLALVAIVSLLLAQWGAYNKPAATFFLLPTRGWELAIGALIAFYFLYKKNHAAFIAERKKTSEVFGFVGLALIGFSIVLFDKNTPFPSVYALLPTVGTALIIIFSNSGTAVGRLLGTRLLVGIGLISYSTYLWHQPLFVFARHWSFAAPGTLLLLTLSALSILLAYLSWRFVEVPFRDRQAINRSNIFRFALGGSLAFAVLGMAGDLTHGFYQQKTSEDQKTALSTATASPRRDDCHTGGVDYLPVEKSCVYHLGNVEWATFGDSHTVELAYALADRLKKREIGLRHFSFSGCAPSLGDDQDHTPCAQWTSEAVDYICSDKKIANVVVSYRIAAHLSGDQTDCYPEIPALKADAEVKAIMASYKRIIDRFVAAGKRVYLVMQAPELPVDINRLIYRGEFDGGNLVGVPKKWWDTRNEYFTAQLSEFNPGVTIIDPGKIFCDSEHCYAAINGVSMYFDDDHMSVAGADKVAEKILEGVVSVSDE